MPILNLNQSSQSLPLEILLRFLENEVGPGDGPAFGDAGKGDGALGAETEVVCCAHGEVGEELEITDGIGAELDVAARDSVFGGTAERAEMDGLDVNGVAEGVEFFLDFGVEARICC